MAKTDNIELLQSALQRLREENAKWREEMEEVANIIRLRAPSSDGLTIKGAVKSILDERDKNLSRVDFYRSKMKSLMKLLIDGRFDEAKKELNIFLFNNKN
jgi:hypothetical protein